jgi:hypothetical protein
MSATHQVLLAGGGLGYQITNSLRFRASNSAYLSRTFGSPTSSSIWTFSAWVKRGLLSSTRYLLGASTTTNFGFNSSDQLTLTLNGVTACTSTAVFRDPTAWMHVVYQQNGSAQTIYVNGSSVATGTTAAAVFNTAIAHQIGAANTTNFSDGYLANVYFIDGQALTPSSFGQTDATTGVWVPKAYSGTYGTNGFFLQFKDATSTTTIGYDTSGSSNNFTTSGISVTSGVTFDQMLDTPTLNYSTGNAVFVPSTNFLVDFRAANLEWGQAASNKNCSGVASIEMRTGKWYWETTVGTVAGSITFGVSRSDLNSSFRGTGTVYYRQDGQKVVDGVASAYGASYVANDVLGFAYDADAGTLTCYKNNTSQGTITITSGSSYGWFPACALDNAGAGVTAFHTFNFGQRPFSYTPPSGFKALNTQNVTSTAVTLSGSFTGNAAADGPFIWTNGNPATLTINGNGVTFGTDADKTAGGFKLRTSSASYNAAGTNNWTATAGNRFVQSKRPNNGQVNP